MNQESKDRQNMRPEYDIRGGMRGKYLERYRQGIQMTITFEESPLMTTSTTSTPPIGSITKTAVYPPAYPSAKIQPDQLASAAR
jgi:hypothetical protein